MAEKRTSAWLMSCLGLCILLGSFPLRADQHQVQRVITLSPHLAELVFLLGAGDKLSGVVDYSDFPQQVKNIPRVGGAAGLDLERVLSINPDLILAWQGGTRQADIQRLKKLGLRVISIKSETLNDIPASLKTLGELLNQQQRASGLIADFDKNLRRLSENYSNQPQHRIFIEISSQPLMGLTKRHPFGEGLALCGLINIFSDIDKAAILTDIESILSRDATYVLLRQDAASNDYSARKLVYQVNGNSDISFVSFDEDTAFRQTPRLLDAVDEVCNAVYGLE